MGDAAAHRRRDRGDAPDPDQGPVVDDRAVALADRLDDGRVVRRHRDVADGRGGGGRRSGPPCVVVIRPGPSASAPRRRARGRRRLRERGCGASESSFAVSPPLRGPDPRGARSFAPAARMSGVDRREFIVGRPRSRPFRDRVPRSVLALVTATSSRGSSSSTPSAGASLRHIATLAVPAQHRGRRRGRGRRALGHRRRQRRRRAGRVRHVLRDFGEPRYTAGSPERAARVRHRRGARRGRRRSTSSRGRVLGRAGVGPRARHVTIDRAGRDALGRARLEGAARSRSSTSPGRRGRGSCGRFAPPFLAHDVGFAPDGRPLGHLGRSLRARRLRPRGRVAARARGRASRRSTSRSGPTART